MGNLYNDLEDLCEIIGDKISEANQKIMNGNDLTDGDIGYLDKLTHALKSIKTTMAMMDSESGDYSGDYDRSVRRYSGARGRSQRTGRYVSRNSGRMTRRASGDDAMVSELRDLMEDAPDDRTRQEFQKFIQKIEQM